jgi:pimeloyl-ACP methyl ester carboxylesterase/MFS family permease
VQKYYFLAALSHAAIMISSTFYILFIIENVGFAKLGLLLSIGFIFQALIDFPTAVLADWLGYKWVLAASYVLHSIAFILLGIIGVIPDDFNFPYLILVFIIEALALAQESGALQSWFDNSYKQSISDCDPSLVIYRGVFGKTLLLIRALGGIAIAIGGYISEIIDREGVFLVQGIIMGVLAGIFIFTIGEIHERRRSSVSLQVFLKNLFLGFKLIFRSRRMLFFQIAYIITIITNLIWLNLLIYPIYFGYTGSDSDAAALRSAIFLVGGLMTMIGVATSKRIRMEKWLPLIVLIYALGYYGGYALILITFPLESLSEPTLNLTAVYLVFILATIGILINTIWLLLLQKLMLEIIPDINRNAFYSLSPTLALVIGSVMAYFIGMFLEDPFDRFVDLSFVSIDRFVVTVLFFLVAPTVVAAFTLFVSLRDYIPQDDVTDTQFHISALDNRMLGPESSIDITKMSSDLKIQSKAKELMDNLLLTATEDGKISDDEQLLLSQTVSNFKQYLELLEHAKDDGIIDQNEKTQLLAGREKILNDAYQIAARDEVISPDEYALLDTLMEIVRDAEKTLEVDERVASTVNAISAAHRWYRDFNNLEFVYKQIFGKWLTPLTEKRLRMDCFLLVNGWLANHQDNYPITKEISHLTNVFSYDARGSGKSIRSGPMTVKQAALDMNYIFMKALQERRKLAESYGIKSRELGKVFLMGSCIGGLPIAAAYAAKLPITKHVAGIVIISPISKFIPHNIVKSLYFLPPVVIYLLKRWFALPIIDKVLPGEQSSDTKQLAIKRTQRIDPYATTRHAREFLWKGEVRNAWKYISVPALLLVGENDPVASLASSAEVYENLQFPIWVKLDAPSHLLLEYNLEYMKENFSSFTKSPRRFYRKYKDSKP